MDLGHIMDAHPGQTDPSGSSPPSRSDNFVVSSDQEQMKAPDKSLDFIIDAASGDHPFDPYLSLLKTNGVMVLVGFPREVKFSPASLNLGMKTISGSITGGTKVTQEMIDFCAANGIDPNVEVVQFSTQMKLLKGL